MLELEVVDLVPEHDVETHEEFAGNGDLGFGAAPALEEGEVETLEIRVDASCERRRLAEHPAKDATALFRDLAEVVGVSRRPQGRGEPDVADDVLTAGEARGWAEDQDGGESSEGPDPGMRAQPSGARIRGGELLDLGIESIDAGVEPGQQLKALVDRKRTR